MKVRSYPVGPIGTNCYLLTDEEAGVCALVDPGDDGAFLLDKAAETGCELKLILLTHGHFDHVTGVPEILARRPGLPVYLHPADRKDAEEGGGFTSGIGRVDSMIPYGEGDTVTLGGLTIRVLHTPGHTPGSVTLMVGDVLFTGDTLFAGSCGRTDFPGGSYAQMMASLARLARLEGVFQVYPGHEGASTLERERRQNYFMREALEQAAQ